MMRKIRYYYIHLYHNPKIQMLFKSKVKINFFRIILINKYSLELKQSIHVNAHETESEQNGDTTKGEECKLRKHGL
jgi:hypothetical protein